MEKLGKVYLVGAGPGDPELITVRGRRLIEHCDALVYDYLAAPEMLKWTPPHCEHICVGKRRGFHSASQSEIQALLGQLARADKCVVRLKGGDPFLFGRGGEEVRFLQEAGIPWEVVPGITAALGAAASLGMPLTDRNYSSGVLFLTGHEDPSHPNGTIDWAPYATLRLTLCLYMSMKHLPEICASLVHGGAPGQTPVHLVEWATTTRERHCHGTLDTIAAKAAAEGISSPSIVLIGPNPPASTLSTQGA